MTTEKLEGLAGATVKSMAKHARKPADFYPTPADVTLAFLEFIKFKHPQSILEPACGDGAMSKVLEEDGHMVISTDLRTNSGYGEGGIDFLNETVDIRPEWIITNPPFNLAEAFIKKALSITPNVAMLLKATYWNAKKRKALFDAHPPSWILPLTWRPAFLEAERGSSPLMDVMWVVWEEDDMPGGLPFFVPLDRPQKLKPAPKKKAAPPDDLNDLLV